MTLSRSRLPDLSRLAAFVAAARYESFSQAALDLSLSQSAVSRQVKELEIQLGIALFHRVRQRIILSDQGRRFLPEAQDLIARAEELTYRALGSRGVTNSLTIATLPTFGSRWLMPRLQAFQAARPGLQLTVLSRAAPFDFASDPADVAIHFGGPSWPNARCSFLFHEAVLPVAAPMLADQVRDRGLGSVPLLQLTHRPRLWADWFDLQGIEAEDAYRGARVDSFSMLVSAAIAGMGAALLPSYLIEEEMAVGQLRALSDRPLGTDQGYYTVVPEPKATSAVVADFEAWLKAGIAQSPPGRTWRPG